MRLGARRKIGVTAGLLLGACLVTFLSWPGQEHLRIPGPMNTLHDDLACDSCHRAAPGTVRQQLQNAARAWIGRDAVPVDIGYRAVGNDECLACHERPDDRHPVFRFLEPRFAEVREELHPERCTSCHREHHGVRITAPETTFCRHCHEDTALDSDPLDVSHRDLVARDRWDTCLGCHDYHGNHVIKAPHRLENAIPIDRIKTYFEGGASPYPPPIRRAVTPEVKTL